MTRREFCALAAAPAQRALDGGTTLVHEHILVDFIGADRITPGRYDRNDVVRVAKPKLEAIYALGCRRFLECTPNYIGRDPVLIRRLAEETGIDIWTNTGLYAAANYKFVPEFARTESAAQLARRWIREFERGIEGVKPRFIKIGVNKGPLGDIDRKFVEAAALCARETGLTIAAHTGDGAAALEELEILGGYGLARKFVWVHAQNELDHDVHAKVAQSGAWVEFDGIQAKSANWHRQCVAAMERRGLLGQTLISQDSGWYSPGEPDGGNFRGYDFLYREFLPAVPEAWRTTLLRDNPKRAFG